MLNVFISSLEKWKNDKTSLDHLLGILFKILLGMFVQIKNGQSQSNHSIYFIAGQIKFKRNTTYLFHDLKVLLALLNKYPSIMTRLKNKEKHVNN